MTSRPAPDNASHEPVLQRWKHEDPGGIPYYDQGLGLAHGRAHLKAITYLVPVLTEVAREAGLLFLSDNPVWYIDPSDDGQKVFYGGIDPDA